MLSKIENRHNKKNLSHNHFIKAIAITNSKTVHPLQHTDSEPIH